MNCTCNRNHVDDDEHAPTCATVLSAELAQLRAERDEWKRKYEEEYRNNPKRAGVHDVSQYYKPEDDDASGALERARGGEVGVRAGKIRQSS